MKVERKVGLTSRGSVGRTHPCPKRPEGLILDVRLPDVRRSHHDRIDPRFPFLPIVLEILDRFQRPVADPDDVYLGLRVRHPGDHLLKHTGHVLGRTLVHGNPVLDLIHPRRLADCGRPRNRVPCLLRHSLLASTVPDELADVGDDDGRVVSSVGVNLLDQVDRAAGGHGVGADDAIGKNAQVLGCLTHVDNDPLGT